jgi:hypothetical protein
LKKDPHSFNNLAWFPEYAPVIGTMRKQVLGWMRATDHPAAERMTDPLNPGLIAEWMAWEKANATQQEEEVERLMKERGPAKPRGSGRRRITRLRDPRPPPVLSSL